jgi:integrase
VPSLVGLRDRALTGVTVCSFARISAIVALQVEDYFANGKRWWLPLHEKGGKRPEMPAHHKLERFLDEYLAAAGIRDGGETPLPLRSGPNRLIDRPAGAPRRRVPDGPPANGRGRPQRQARLPRVSRNRHHRLSRGRRYARKPQATAAHESPRTTKLYDRTGDQIRSTRSSGFRFEDEAPVLAWWISGDRFLPPLQAAHQPFPDSYRLAPIPELATLATEPEGSTLAGCASMLSA